MGVIKRATELGVTVKECIACAEEIKENAKLCRFCNTRQDDPSFRTSVGQSSASLSDERSALLVRLVDDYKHAWDRYGPFQIVDESEASEVDRDLVWTQVEGSEYTAMINGLVDTSSRTGWFFIAKSPFSEEQQLLVTDCAYFDCETCDGDFDGCTDCQESGTVCIDIQDVVLRSGVTLDSPEDIWRQRVPGGTIDRIQLPSDFENYPEFPLPSWVKSY